MLYEDGYVEHVISSKVAISEMWSLAPFIISIYTKNIEGHKPRIKLLYLLIQLSVVLVPHCFNIS